MPSTAQFKEQIQKSAFNPADYVHIFRQHDVKTADGSPMTVVEFMGYISGRLSVPDNVQRAVSCISEYPELFSNARIVSQFQQQAVDAPSIHEALKSLRLSLGLTLYEMSAALRPHLPSDVPPSRPTICYWESPSSNKRSTLPSEKIFAGTDPITAYGHVFHDHGMGDWFDQHAAHFREMLLTAMVEEREHSDNRAKRYNECPTTGKPPFWDAYLARQRAAESSENKR